MIRTPRVTAQLKMVVGGNVTRKAGGLRELRNVSGNRPGSYDCKEVSSANDLHELGSRRPPDEREPGQAHSWTLACETESRETAETTQNPESRYIRAVLGC